MIWRILLISLEIEYQVRRIKKEILKFWNVFQILFTTMFYENEGEQRSYAMPPLNFSAGSEAENLIRELKI